MKKVLFPILALVLAVGLAIPVAMPAAADMETVDLIAGQHIDVGEVKVWNDGDNLYVKYVVDAEGWCLTETHLHVATSMESIPQTQPNKKGLGGGNPIPGQFDYKAEHDCVTEYTYTIPLDEEWVPCETNLHIAAHAEVQKLGDVMTASLVTGAGTDNVLVIEEDPFNLNYPIGYAGPYGGTPTPSVVIQGTPAGYSGWPTITGAQWISDSLENPGSANTWRLFTRSFSLPSNATNISGTLQINSDNAEEVKLNDNVVGSYGEVYGAFTDNQEWKTKLSYSVTPIPGDNTLEVMVRNYYWVPTPGMWNYTGLIYKMDYEYQLLFTETAWGDGFDFDGRNWAMYFKYHIQEPCVPEKECVYFCTLELGASVEGLGSVHEDLNIQAPGDAVKVAEGEAPAVYGAPNGPGSIWNGGMDPDCGGFSDITTKEAKAAHDYTFTFAPGISVTEFSLRMLDFGDYNPSKSTSHVVTMTAYDASDVQVDQMTLQYTSDGQGNPRSPNLYGDLWYSGDAISASEGEPGNWMWTVSGSGIVRVELDFGVGFDPNIAFDSLCFTIECP